LRTWILDTKKAGSLTKSDNFHEIKTFVQKVGTNPTLSDKIVSYNFAPPFNFLAEFYASRARGRGEQTSFSTSENLQNFSWWTRGESNPRVENRPIRDYRVSLFVLLFEIKINKNIKQLP